VVVCVIDVVVNGAKASMVVIARILIMVGVLN